jgi:hypothetical protein
MKFTEEHKQKISEALKNRKFSDNHKMNISKSLKGRPSKNKGKIIPKISENNKQRWGNPEYKKRVSNSMRKPRNIKHSEEWKKNHSIRMQGKNNPNWHGGVALINKYQRVSKENFLWRKRCLERDDFTCQECGALGKLEVHHIKPFAKYPELRFDINNGITLCLDCHCKVDKARWNILTRENTK